MTWKPVSSWRKKKSPTTTREVIEDVDHRRIEKLKRDHERRHWRLPSGGSSSLTQRELQILNLVSEGWADKAIALELKIAESTVKHTLSSIRKKLVARNRAHAVHRAWQTGWYSIPSQESRSRDRLANSPPPCD
jgi:DNA-binding NarL/FixJ family response regulator